MDGIAKFVGYIVLLLVAIGALNSYFGNQGTEEAAKTAAPPLRDRCQELETTQRVHGMAEELLRVTNDFGTNVESSLHGCTYFAAEDTTIVDVVVSWNGPLSGDFYQKMGRLTLSSQGWKWEETKANEALRTYRALMGIAGILVATAADSAGSAPNQGALFRVSNECSHPVTLAISYTDVSGEQRVAGWWNIAANSEMTLADADSRPLRTRSPAWYFYARATDDNSIVWTGEHKVVFDRSELPMQRLIDRDGDSEWSLQCVAEAI